ncbi:TPM domain-containing protein [Streptomyces sp. SP18CS02]|uniref:TPM domain-containing protein n=1 Tax=Streptomyces sp. SP18CS02 TaxID=3002531 RepID=UPI002E75DAAF|nr:TPM domain-containing protein [Streptomyces sp. SP18CS02]MEE1756358.1 TPM domain-containing protein [Streptomyces sp. SP18CS02]
MAARVLLAVLVAAWWLVVPAARDAPAEEPVPLSRQGQITDRVGALGEREQEVARALDALYDDQRVQLFVVYVRDFAGRPAQDWADSTATRNGLGGDDVLLAVATHDRRYACSATVGSRLTQPQLDEVARTAIEPALRADDWAGAAAGAADGYGAILAGRPVPTPAITPGEADPGGGGSRATDLILPVVLIGGAAATAAYAYTKRRRRGGTRTTPQGDRGRGPAKGRGEVPLTELDARARTALVETDDAVSTSREELGFAVAQFGEEAARPFTEAVDHARSELTTAFRLRQQLDDAHPEDDATRRRMLEEIMARCARADRRLDAESEAFDRLRALERTAPEALRAAETAFRDLTGRAGAARRALTTLRERYAESAAAPVASGPEQAGERLLFASTHLDRARRAVDGGDSGAAAVHVRAAEGALDQAARLIDAVDRRAVELARAADRLPGALTEAETDLADAWGLLKGTPPEVSTAGLRGRIARAESVVGDVRRASAAGRYDPIDALRRVEEADSALDEALAGAREREQGTRRASALLEQAMLTARSAVGAADDYITTHRGAVGSQARTRLAEARRRLERARRAGGRDAVEGTGPGGSGAAPGPGSGGDPQAALGEAQQADALARQAQALAEQDVRAYGNPDGLGGGVAGAGGGGLGGGVAGAGGGGLGGAVLGGIILGGLLGGGGRGFGGGPGAGRGAGGFGGFGGGPGSFGGGGTRGRLGGGGRF